MITTAAALAACRSTPTRIFTLSAIAPAAPLERYAGAPVRLDAVHVPPDLDRTEVVTLVTSAELEVHDSAHWSAPLGQIARQALFSDLLARLPADRLIFPHLAKPSEALGISVDLVNFRAEADGASLAAGWAVQSSDPAVAPRRHVCTLHVTAIGSGGGVEATATVLSRLLAQLADLIVADLLVPSTGG